MAIPDGDFSSIRFSTDSLPEHERFAGWRELYGRQVLRLEHEPLPDQPFHVDTRLRMLPGLAIASVRSSLLRVGRTSQLVSDGDSSLILQITTCPGVASQLGHTVAVRPGDAVVLSAADVGHFTFSAASDALALRLPRQPLVQLVQDLDAALVRALPSESPPLRLLKRYIAAFENVSALIAPDLQHLTATHVYDLIAIMLGATRDAADTANGRGVRAARLHAIKADILADLASSHLSLEAVARRQGISPVYIRKLFEGEDTSFTQFVLEQRLLRAHRMLNDPRFADHPIAAIAMEAGFGDLSYFNRAFRRRYRASPSNVRAAKGDEPA
jgi:AraC-like DNA-binding protein